MESGLSFHINNLSWYRSYNGTSCFATGWGKDKFGDEGSYQRIMKQVELNIVADDKCEGRELQWQVSLVWGQGGPYAKTFTVNQGLFSDMLVLSPRFY